MNHNRTATVKDNNLVRIALVLGITAFLALGGVLTYRLLLDRHWWFAIESVIALCVYSCLAADFGWSSPFFKKASGICIFILVALLFVVIMPALIQLFFVLIIWLTKDESLFDVIARISLRDDWWFHVTPLMLCALPATVFFLVGYAASSGAAILSNKGSMHWTEKKPNTAVRIAKYGAYTVLLVVIVWGLIHAGSMFKRKVNDSVALHSSYQEFLKQLPRRLSRNDVRDSNRIPDIIDRNVGRLLIVVWQPDEVYRLAGDNIIPHYHCPSSVSDVTTIAIIRQDEMTVRTYNLGADFQVIWNVSLFDNRTGKFLDTQRFFGSIPKDRSGAPAGLDNRRYGSPPTTDLYNWLITKGGIVQ